MSAYIEVRGSASTHECQLASRGCWTSSLLRWGPSRGTPLAAGRWACQVKGTRRRLQSRCRSSRAWRSAGAPRMMSLNGAASPSPHAQRTLLGSLSFHSATSGIAPNFPYCFFASTTAFVFAPILWASLIALLDQLPVTR